MITHPRLTRHPHRSRQGPPPRDQLRSAPAAVGVGADGGPPRELEAEDAYQLVDDLVSALELAEENDEDEEPQEPDDLDAGDPVDCDADDGLDEDE